MNKAKQILSAQNRRFLFIAGIILLFLVGIGHFVFQDMGPALTSTSRKIDLPVDKINPQDIWMNRQDNLLNRLENDKKITDLKIKQLEDVILTSKKKEEDNEKEQLELKKIILHLQKDLKTMTERTSQNQAIVEEVAFVSPSLPKPTKIDSFSIPPPPAFLPPSSSLSTLSPSEKDGLPLRAPLREYGMREEKRSAVSVDKVVPAAVSVKALLVSSVDAVCGVYATSDPVPVKLRLLDDAHLPKGVTVKLKGCLLLGSAYGNISNERVYMRLERLTQVSPKGEAIETEVAGYVSGEDGKFGVQGRVIDRSAKIVKNAVASGFLGGVGQVLQSSFTRQPVDCWNTYSVGSNAATKGAAGGASSAFDMLADYYIKRAEQVQPVLQVNSGRIVDITFTHGFEIGDLNTQEKVREIRRKSRGKVS